MARGKKTAKELTPEEKLAQALVPIEEQPYQIPENWCWTYVGYLCNFIGGGTPNKNNPLYWNGSIPWASVKDIKGNYLLCTIDSITEEGLNTSATNLCEENDLILVTRIEPAKTIISRIVTAINQDLKIVKSRLTSAFLHYYFENFKHEFEAKASGSTVKGITIPNIKNTYFPLPPLLEQQRIVDRIESIFAKLDEAKEKAQEVVEGFELRKSAILHKAFTGELTEKWRENNFSDSAAEYLTAIQKDNEETTKLNFKFWTNNILPEGWVESKIGNLLYYAGRIGWKGLKADEYKDEGPLLLSVYNLNEGDKVSYNKVYHISEQRYDESPEIMVQENDILLVKDGAGIGKLAYVKDLPQKSTINSSLLLIRSGEAAYFKYIYYLLSGPSLQRIVKERITGSATPHLFQRDIKEFTIPIPPLQEQKFIASVLDNMIKKEQQAKETAEVVIEQIDVMKKAVLARAFRGELGTNDPEEESAVELLKVIL